DHAAKSFSLFWIQIHIGPMAEYVLAARCLVAAVLTAIDPHHQSRLHRERARSTNPPHPASPVGANPFASASAHPIRRRSGCDVTPRVQWDPHQRACSGTGGACSHSARRINSLLPERVVVLPLRVAARFASTFTTAGIR